MKVIATWQPSDSADVQHQYVTWIVNGREKKVTTLQPHERQCDSSGVIIRCGDEVRVTVQPVNSLGAGEATELTIAVPDQAPASVTDLALQVCPRES